MQIIYGLFAFHISNIFAYYGAKKVFFHSKQFGLSSDAGYADDAVFQGTTKNKNPSRIDSFKILFSGIIGVDAKDIHFKNGHLLKSFPVSM